MSKLIAFKETDGSMVRMFEHAISKYEAVTDECTKITLNTGEVITVSVAATKLDAFFNGATTKEEGNTPTSSEEEATTEAPESST